MAEPPVDPEVLAILNEMKESDPVPVAAPPAPPPPPPRMPVAVAPVVITKPGVVWFQSETAKKAVVAAAIAYVLFHPKTLETLYEKVPALGKIQSFDGLIRVVLLALVLYLVMVKFNI